MLTQKRLKENLSYNSKSGDFIWIKPRKRVVVGSLAGSVRKNGYITISIDRKAYYAHRLAWLYVFGELPSGQIDHIDHVRGNNRIGNLRSVTNQENALNRRLINRNTSGVTGVHLFKATGRWQAQICIEGKRIHLGYFNNISSAIKARKDAEVLHGFHKNTGQLLENSNG